MPNLGLSITALLVAMFSIQSGASVAKGLFPLIGAPGTTALRCTLATFLLLPVFRPWKQKLSRSVLFAIARYGVALAGMNLFFYIALQRIPLGLTVALEFTGPLAIAFLYSRRPLDFLWALLAVAGIILILPLTHSSQALDPLGVAFALAAGACWALYIVFGQRAGGSIHGGVAATLGMAVAALVLLPIGVASQGTKLFDPKLLPAAFAVALLSSALPYPLEMAALKRTPTKTFGIFMSVEPAIATLSGFIFLHENLSFTQYLAIGCVIVASAGSAATAKRRKQ